MRGRRKKTPTVNKEIHSENWCFVCKDGGDLRICDYKQCLKSYHPGCVGKEESFLKSEKKWDCAWHRCLKCSTSSYLHCYTCTNAVCRHCLPDAEILQVKGVYGLCNLCLKLALLFEEKKDCDFDGVKVDFTDRETCEGLFMEYYEIVKNNEGFELADIYAAKERVAAKKNHQPESGSEDCDEEEEDQVSDYDDLEDEKSKHRKTRKRPSGRNPARRTPVRTNKKEFIGWASRSLIEFLNSIGKSTAEKLSQYDVTSIVHDYAKENKLWRPGKKKIIMCDDPLWSLFRKKTINRSRVYDYLEDHFAENLNESEEDEVGYDSENSNLVGNLNACKRQRKMDVEKTQMKKDSENNLVPIESRFASIVVENVKLVYLKRSVLKEMLKEPELFEEKVRGCFVRVKSDPYDYQSRNSHQLMQVKGVKTVSTDEHNTETVLLLSVMPKEICISLIPDEDFTEAEFEDFREKVVAGEIQRPTVEYLQQKARSLHKDMTNVRIRKELDLLKNLIDQANEKGWRREPKDCDLNCIASTLFVYLEKRKTLQSPMEQARLLENVPMVIPEPEPEQEQEPEPAPAAAFDSGGIEIDGKSDESSSESTTPCDSVPMVIPEPEPAAAFDSGSIETDGKSDEGSPESTTPCDSVPSDERQDQRELEENTQHGLHTPPSGIRQPIYEKSTSVEPQQGCTPESELKRIEVIDIMSDDEGQSGATPSPVEGNPEDEVWCMKGPDGERNNCTLRVLRLWSKSSPYSSKFMVWKENGREEEAIPLLEAISAAPPVEDS